MPALVLKAPWLGLFGGLDRRAGAAETDELSRRLRACGDVFSQVVRYADVGAEFHRQSSDGLTYAASYDAWQRVFEWFDARVAPRLTPLALAWRERSQR
jgi:dienelactone hydrolase